MPHVPNLVIIGAQKSGTTSLHYYLNSHPQIFMSNPVKEPGYFMKTKFILSLFQRINKPVKSRREMAERYMLSGYKAERYFGESSTYYTAHNNSDVHNVPARMEQANPAMKLIYIVRNPFARIVSNYLHELQRGRIRGDFKEFIGSPDYARALMTSRYWHQLEPYLAQFPEQQIKVVLFEDLVESGQRVVDDIYGFLELEPTGEVSFKAHNRSENRQTFHSGELLFPPDAHREAARLLIPEVRKLQDFMQRELDRWDLSMDRWCDRLTPPSTRQSGVSLSGSPD